MAGVKCKDCGYHKNKPNASHCALCGKVFDGSEGAGEAVVGEARNASKKVETADADRARKDQIVYAGDFAIVYAFAPTIGSLIVLQPGEVFTFGRGDACDFKIDSKAVSRRHARVHWSGNDPPTPEIVDLESKNGVTVNGVPVTRKVLEDGDEVMMGPFAATLRVLSANDSMSKQIAQVDRLSATMVGTRRLTGEVKLVPPAWLLGHLERIKESGTLTVQAGEDQRGYVAMISGVPIAAGWGEGQTGVDAIRAVVRLKEGRFSFTPRSDAAPQAINTPLLDILAQEAPELSGRPSAAIRRPAPPLPPRGGAGPGPGGGGRAPGGPPRRPPPARPR